MQPPPSIVVLKFGSSVLRSAADLPRVVDEVYRHVRKGQRVLAVVSAYAGETDRLFAEAPTATASTDPYETAAYVATGELRAADELRTALDQSGVPARVVLPREIGLRATGSVLDAELLDVDPSALLPHLSEGVVIVPGFIALDEQERTVLLGRGGTDLSAIFIAQRLLAECVLIKDVDGVYVRDPALPGPQPPRFAFVTWEEAVRVGGGLVQPKAIEWARSRSFAFRVAAIGSIGGTRVNGMACASLPNGERPAPLRIVLLGLGTVGGGIYERLLRFPEHFAIQRILVRHPDKHVARGVPSALLTTAPCRTLDVCADVFVDAMGPGEPAASLTLAALAAGRKVVTANKVNAARHWEALELHKPSDWRRVRCSASVGGGVPVLEILDSQRLSSRVVSVRAVLNSTCNFMLERMQAGLPYKAALSEAQMLGFAEPDPQFDVSGQDAVSKLILLSVCTFRKPPESIECEGINASLGAAFEVARDCGGVLKLVGTLERRGGQVRAGVEPQVLAAEDFLAGARLEENRFEITLHGGDTLRLRGRGAGRGPTATAVMGDLWAVRRELS